MVERAAELGDDGVAVGRRWLAPRQWATHAFVLGSRPRLSHRSASRASRAELWASTRARAADDRVVGPRAPKRRVQGSLQRDQRRSGLGRDSQVGPEVPHRERGCRAGPGRAGSPGSRRASRWTSGDHGARLSTTSTTSASASQGSGSAPTYIGCSAEIAVATAQHWHTGIAHSSASRASAANPASLPAPRWAKISGRSARASSSAARRQQVGVRAVERRGAIDGGASSAAGGHGSHSTSRGRLRYTGPLGVRVGDRVGPVEQARAPARGSAARSPTCTPRARAPPGRASPGPSRSARCAPRSGPASMAGVRPDISDHRHVVGGGVDGADRAVGQPDVGVQDHRLRAGRWRRSSRGPCP